MKERGECIFAKFSKNLGVDPLVPCSGVMTRHHVWNKAEGGNGVLNWQYQGEEHQGRNLIGMCEAHQRHIHSSQVWGGEDFSYLIKLKGGRHGKRK